MKVQVSKEDITEALKAADDVVGARSVAILPNVYLETQENGVKVMAYNGELGIDKFVSAEVEEPGRAILMAKKTYDIVRELPPEDIHIEADENGNIKIKPLSPETKIEFNIKGIPPEDLMNVPEVEENEKKAEFVVESDMLREKLNKVSFASSPSEITRPAFTGICFSIINDEMMELVATDGKQLALTRVDITGSNLPENYMMVVPLRTIKLITDTMTSGGECTVKFTNNLIEFSTPSTRIISNLIEDPFPNYRDVIPPNTENVLEVETYSLEKAIRRIAIIADANLKKIKVEVSEEIGLKISTENPAFGSGYEIVNASYKGEPMTLGFNYTFLLNPTRVLKDETARFFFTDPTKAVKVLGTESDDFLYLAMPMMIEEE